MGVRAGVGDGVRGAAVGGGGRAETTGGDGEKMEGGGGETGGRNFTEKGGAVVGSARGVPEESGGRKRGHRELQDGGGAPVLELHGAGAGARVRPGGVSGLLFFYFSFTDLLTGLDAVQILHGQKDSVCVDEGRVKEAEE